MRRRAGQLYAGIGVLRAETADLPQRRRTARYPCSIRSHTGLIYTLNGFSATHGEPVQDSMNTAEAVSSLR